MLAPLFIFGGAILATIIGVTASRKETAASDLRIEPVGVELNPLKNIKGGQLSIPVTLSIRNIHGSSLNLQAIDLAIEIDGRQLAQIQDYKPFKIQGVNSTTHKVVARTGIANMALVLGAQVLRAIGGLRAGQKLEDILPREARLVGQIRAEGFVFDIDEAYPISTKAQGSTNNPKR
jgi:hypothetical protein